MIEYTLKWIGIGAVFPAALLCLFCKSDKWLQKEFKHWLSNYLLGIQISSKTDNIWIQFIRVFDRFFGANRFHWKFFLRSCQMSTASVCIMIFIWYVVHPDDVFILFVVMKTLGFTPTVVFILALFPINFVPDYISLIETRFLINLLSSKKAPIAIILLLDLIFTSTIFLLVLPIVASSIIIFAGGNPANYSVSKIFSAVFPEGILLLPAGNSAFTIGILFYSTFFTSIWLWVYVSGIFTIRLLAQMAPLIKFLQWALPIKREPMCCIGVVAFLPATLIGCLISLLSGV